MRLKDINTSSTIRRVMGFFLIAILVFPLAVYGSQNDLETSIDVQILEPHVEGEVLIKFKEKRIDIDRVTGKVLLNSFVFFQDLKKEDTIVPQNLTLVSSKSNESTSELIDRLEDDSRVEYVVPNYLRRISDVPAQTFPNDLGLNKMWSIHNTGQIINGIVGIDDADIDAPEAWGVFRGNPSMIVGVLDTGIDLNHPDLAGNLWDGSSACKNESGVIIPGGCLNHGWNFVDNTNSPDVAHCEEPNRPDPYGHGTHVAGTIGATGNNVEGVVGVNWNVKIMAIKVADSCGFVSSSTWIKGLNFAKQNGAKVVNASFGGFNFSQAESDAIKDFPGIFVAAAGNDVSDNDNLATPNFPSNYDLSNVIAVAASNSLDNLASFSNFGVINVDVAAPGANILSTFPDDEYAYLSGTSMAAPHVAGLAALLWGYAPNLSVAQVIGTVLSSGDSVNGLSGKVATGRRINAYAALKAVATVPSIVSTVLQDDGAGGMKLRVTFTAKDGVGALPITLKQFEYSVDGGVTFAAPTGGDLSGALSVATSGATWSSNSYVTSLSSAPSPTEYLFTVDMNHADLVGVTKPLQKDIRIRFKTNNTVSDSDFVTSTDVVPSTATLSGAPSSFVAMKNVSVTVAGADVTQYAYKLDSGTLGSFVDVAVPLALADLLDGAHTLSVYGKDANGNVQITPTVASWTVDTTGPTGTIAVTTLSPMKTKTPILALTVSDAGVNTTDKTGVKVRLSCNDTHNSVSSLVTFSDTITSFDVQSGSNACGSADGDRTIYATFQDALGNVGPIVKTDTFNVFTGPIVVQILTKPSSTSGPSVTFTIGGTFVTAYKYRLDPVNGVGEFSPETPVGSPLVLSGTSALADGPHKVEFIAKDDVGNFQSVETATSYSWTVDAVAPIFSLSNVVASGGATSATTMTISITGNDMAAYKYSLDNGAFSSESLVSTPIALSGLAEGSHTVKIIARDAVGNYNPEASATVYNWTVDLTPPSNIILSRTPNGDTLDTSMTITVGGSSDIVVYKFSLDGSVFGGQAGITTPISLSGLAVGSHTVRVIARDDVGNFTPEANAAALTWNVLAPPAPAPAVSPPAPSGGGGGGGGGFSPAPAPVISSPVLPTTAVAAPAPAKPTLSTLPSIPQKGTVLGASTVNLVDGLILKLEGRGLYYIIQNGQKRPIPYATYRKKYLKKSKAVPLPSALLRKIPSFRAGK